MQLEQPVFQKVLQFRRSLAFFSSDYQPPSTSTQPFIRPSAHPSIHLPIFLPAYPPIQPSIHPSTCPSIYLPTYLPTHPSIHSHSFISPSSSCSMSPYCVPGPMPSTWAIGQGKTKGADSLMNVNGCLALYPTLWRLHQVFVGLCLSFPSLEHARRSSQG